MLAPSKQKQFLESQAKGLYDQWVQTQKELRAITDPTIKAMWLEELNSYYVKAQKLLDEPLLEGSLHQSYLKIILTRSPEQWAVLAKSDNKPIIK